jgi:hypothetical protein
MTNALSNGVGNAQVSPGDEAALGFHPAGEAKAHAGQLHGACQRGFR